MTKKGSQSATKNFHVLDQVQERGSRFSIKDHQDHFKWKQRSYIESFGAQDQDQRLASKKVSHQFVQKGKERKGKP